MKIGPKFKIARRLGARIFPKTQTTKFSISGSGQRKSAGAKRGRPKALSDYGLQLIEKQKVRFAYGLKEHQLASYVAGARKQKTDTPASSLYKKLEMRLDNVVFRAGLVPSRAFARQLVSHGHIRVNNRRLNIPSHILKVGDEVSVRPESRTNGAFKNLDERLKQYQTPAWLLFNPDKMTATVKAEPLSGQTDLEVNYAAILEFYSRV